MKEVLSFNPEEIVLKRQSSADFLKKGSFLWAFHHKAIPHLGLSIDGRYYSVTFNKKQINESVAISWRLSQNKAIPCFFIELNDTFAWQANIHNYFEAHSFKENTCLLPILQSMGLSREKIEILPDLIDYLSVNTKIKSWHGNAFFQKERLSLLRYTKDEVMEMVKKGRTT
jgi:hypothetical protein